MTQWKFWFRVVLMLMMCGMIWFSWPQTIESRTPDNKPIKIGLSMATLQEERWRRDRDFFAERLRQLGGELIVQNANNNSGEQARQVAYLLSKKINVLVIVPNDLNQAAAAVQLAKKAGIKVISYDRLIRNANLDLYISFDNIKVGQFMAEFLLNKVPTGKYVIINGAPSDHNSLLFNEGYKRILNPYIQDLKVEVAFETWAENWRPEYAYQYIQGLLAQERRFDAVIAANDNLASAVIEALAEWRLAGKVMVVGHDADLSGCQRIVEGTQLMTVYKPIRQLAYRAADMAMALAANKEIKTNYSPIYNGKYFIPAEIITPIPIDRDNMDIIIRDRFHRKEEIYMNVPRSKWPK
jgi:D-xylose transport system substrate-binding protein